MHLAGIVGAKAEPTVSQPCSEKASVARKKPNRNPNRAADFP
jgi:hypothetical protein